jgi:hypothetical protein
LGDDRIRRRGRGDSEPLGADRSVAFFLGDRTKKILTEVVALANATSGSLFMNPSEADWYYYPASAWFNPLFISAMGRRLTSS